MFRRPIHALSIPRRARSAGCGLRGIAAGRLFVVGAFGLAVLGVGDARAAASDFVFVKVADTSTPAPGSSGNFSSMGQISLDEAGFFAFRGEAPETGVSIYVGEIANPSALVLRYSRSTPIPGGSGSFETFGHVSLSDGDVAFRGTGSGGQVGVYTDFGRGLSRIADTSTAVPGGVGTFLDFGQPWIWDGAVVFRAVGTLGQDGIYKLEGGQLTVVADQSTPMPGGTGNFASFGGSTTILTGVPAFDIGITVFQGSDGSGHAGVYAKQRGVVSVIADTDTAIPGGVGSFTAFDGSVQAANTCTGMVAFRGEGSGGQNGIYTYINGVLAPALDTQTFLPEFGGSITSVGTQNYAFEGGRVASLGEVGPGQGIFTTIGGVPRVLVRNGDVLDGQSVLALGVYGQSFNGETIGFNVGNYGGQGPAIFLAELAPPVPSWNAGSLSLLTLALGALGIRALRGRR